MILEPLGRSRGREGERLRGTGKASGTRNRRSDKPAEIDDEFRHDRGLVCVLSKIWLAAAMHWQSQWHTRGFKFES
jgi:hypothetical protein